ncbi:MAG TPA: phosphatidylinositol-specific phospholipase C domain-containing protein [Puia sp.]|jgi:hypothetical protein|nr:phosphatidylinositol-specific phospholipase C domain-containing protein [Puia sp.]
MRYLFLLLIGLLALSGNTTRGQNLSFSPPVNFLPNATSTKAIDITLFKKTHFVTWNDARNGSIHVTWLGKQYSDPSDYSDATIPEAESAAAPVLRATPDHIYVLWIDREGAIKYAINSSDTGFANSTAHTLSAPTDPGAKDPTDPGARAPTGPGAKAPANTPASLGLTAAWTGDRIVITTHAANKETLLYTTATIGTGGILNSTGQKKVPAKSSDYPFVVARSADTIRLLWRGYKDEGIYYADASLTTGNWTKTNQLPKAKTKLSPAIYRVFDSDKLFYIWKGNSKDNNLYYTTEEKDESPVAETQLPSYFSTQTAVSICNIDKKRFILAYTGPDNKLYLCWFINYNPARWMEESLYPAKAAYSLKDIALPGAHDAGMSVLTATGGQQSGTINECNTLTQTQNIKAQLNAGIRMFDLRIGTYNKALYTKHCSSDCMADAIGGGYGERLGEILSAIKDFLTTNKKEALLLSFSHFCEKEASASQVARYIIDTLGQDLIFANKGKKLDDIKLEELAGKVIIVFEQYATSDKLKLIDSCSIAASSGCFINFRREYAATNLLNDLLQKEHTFFTGLSASKPGHNDLVRLDWQLTQSSDEAAMICNDFQSENINPLINGAMLLTNALRNHHSIKDLSLTGNRSVLPQLNRWLADGTINKLNKPNILYVDVAGGWITDYCIQLNDNPLYQK